jgi:hypothetical protein
VRREWLHVDFVSHRMKKEMSYDWQNGLKERSTNNSRADAIGQLGSSRAGFKLPVVQSQGDELLKTGIDLLVHGRVLGSDGSQLLK